MTNSYISFYMHIIFSTKGREPMIVPETVGWMKRSASTDYRIVCALQGIRGQVPAGNPVFLGWTPGGVYPALDTGRV